MTDPHEALKSIEDYEACVRAAHPDVKHVSVRAHSNDSKIPPGVVRITARASARRRLSRTAFGAVRAAVHARHQVNVKLEWR